MTNRRDTLLARAQVGLATFVAMAFVAVIFVLIFYAKDMSSQAVTILGNLLAVLATIFTLQMNYFFARHRPADQTDPPPGDPSNENAKPADSVPGSSST